MSSRIEPAAAGAAPLGLAPSVALYLGVMGATTALGGWALYYVADDAVRGWVSVTHWVLGLALPVLLLAHIVGARRERRAGEHAARRPPGL